jgi:alpha-1,2-glucosyltransferase
LLFRQTNVVWLLLVAGHVFFVEGARGAATLLRRLWPCLLGLSAFGAFVAWNGGVALGDAGAHRPGFHLGNVFFALLLFAGIFLPRALHVLWTRRAGLATPAVLLALAALGVVFVCSFGVEHAYNRFGGFLRNDLLLAADDSLALRAALAAPVLLAAFMLAADRLALPAYNLLLPVALLSMVPIRLVDQRYAFTALALYQLFRREDPPWLEVAGLLWSAGLCVWVVEGLARGAFLL